MFSRQVRYAVVGLLLAGLAGCGSCDSEPGAGSNGTGNGDALGADVTFSGSGGGIYSGDCSGAREVCGGTCVATRLNPDHCGSCGNACGSNEVCNSGQCISADGGDGDAASGCPTGLTNCNGRCVDTETNPDHCGGCGESCSDGKACGHSTCVDPIDVGDAPAKCKGGGPSVEIGFEESNTKKVCSGRVAKTTFKWAVCSCDGINLMNNVLTDGYDSTQGPYTQGGFGGGLGSNGPLNLSKAEIYGATWTSSSDGISSGVELTVEQQMHSQGPVTFGAKGSVDGNAWIGGDIGSDRTGPGGGPGGGGGEPVPFAKTLYIPSSASIAGRIQANNVVRQQVNVSKVCSRCEEDKRIPVEQIVKNHKNNNDNAAIGLDEDALVNPGKDVVLRLPCGKYYLSEIDVSGKVTILATGNTALFVDGPINSGTDFTIQPTPSGEFDVFINGDVTLQNDIEVGSAAYPAFMRFYTNGEWTFKNDAEFGAYIYAIPGGITSMNNIIAYGGMYTQRLGTMNNVSVHYDREVLDVDRDCPDPDDGDDGGDAGQDDGGGGGSGGDDGGSTSCKDKGQNCSTDGDCCGDYLCSDGTCGSSCVESGGSCSADGDCCSPLVCDNGVCETSGCNNLYESCSADSDCCSGSCGGGVCKSG